MKIDQQYISLCEASKLTPYDANYLGLLVRKKRLFAVKKNGKWFTTTDAVKEYLKEVSQKSLDHYGFRGTSGANMGLVASIFIPITIFVAIAVFVSAEGASSVSSGEENATENKESIRVDVSSGELTSRDTYDGSGNTVVPQN